MLEGYFAFAFDPCAYVGWVEAEVGGEDYEGVLEGAWIITSRFSLY